MRAAAGEDTTMPQFRVLAQLSEAPRTLSALAKGRRVSLQSMSVLVQSLVERGWIERLPDPSDRRQPTSCRRWPRPCPRSVAC